MKYILKEILSEGHLDSLRKVRNLSQLAYQDVRFNVLGQVLPMKPTFISMMANDVCNSRCQMCLIWKQKKDMELIPDELKIILNDPFFDQVKHIGVTGGEPTLRQDLPNIFQVLCTRQPKLDGVSIITNAILEKVVQERVSACAQICRDHGIHFGVMVSLDGLGDVHDTVRGRKNNFQSALNTINYFREQEIPVSFGCTITSSNAIYVDELLDFAISEGLYGRFRVAEYINRLYNDEQTEHIRDFDEKTAYHLGLFFYRLEHCGFEKVPAHLKTYRSKRAMLVEDKPRQTGCPYHTHGVILTARGELLYCSPKSPVLGSVLTQSPSKIYFSNISKRREIIKNNCDNCIHDYHVPPTFREKIVFYLECRRRSRIYNCSSLIVQAKVLPLSQKTGLDLSTLGSDKVLIVGWYGTETVGDKAILWSIIHRLRSRPKPPKQIYLASLEPFVCQWTVKEMVLGNISIVKTFSKDFEGACRNADEVVVGGGPLMDLEALNHILFALIQGVKSGAVNRVEGCGLGPLVDPVYTQVVEQILRLSHHVTLRDSHSVDRCEQEFSIRGVVETPDPATEYVEVIKSQAHLLSSTPPLGGASNISCFLREWGRDYGGALSDEEFIVTKTAFETELVKLIMYVARLQSVDHVHLLPMHTFYMGGDDRILNRRLAKSLKISTAVEQQSLDVEFARGPISPLEILQSMHQAQFNICMRFHSVLFAETLGVPYLAIDYTGGGKIRSLLKQKGKLNHLISLKDVADGKWQEPIRRMLIPQATV